MGSPHAVSAPRANGLTPVPHVSRDCAHPTPYLLLGRTGSAPSHSCTGTGRAHAPLDVAGVVRAVPHAQHAPLVLGVVERVDLHAPGCTLYYVGCMLRVACCTSRVAWCSHCVLHVAWRFDAGDPPRPTCAPGLNGLTRCVSLGRRVYEYVHVYKYVHTYIYMHIV